MTRRTTVTQAQTRQRTENRASPPFMGDVARWRQGAYRLLSALLMPPSPQSIDALPRAVRFLDDHGAWTVASAFHGAWQRLASETRGLVCEDLPVLQAEYAALFGPGAHSPIPLYETGYLTAGGSALGEALASLERAYAAGGVRLGGHQHGRPDHGAVELEFVSFLCGREADAWDAGAPAAASAASDRQRRFLEAHLCWWIPSAAWLLAERDQDGLYAAAVGMAHSLTVHDADLLRVLEGRDGRSGCGPTDVEDE